MRQPKRLFLLIFLSGILAGSFGTLVWNYFRPFNTKYGNIVELKKNKGPRSLFDLFMGSTSPFESPFHEQETIEEDPTKNAFSFSMSLGGNEDLVPSEDEKFYYYTLNLDQMKAKTLNVNVENHQIIVQAQMESKETDENSIHSFSQSFTKSIPAPPNANLDKIEVENKENKVVIKVPKN